jgi:fido (protein-threonine AMPylation protein)/biotin operon repressor
MLIHRRLFSGVFFSVKAGKFRDYNISKREWVLDGESVLYANADMIRQTLDYDFGQEKSFDYSKLTTDEVVKHIARFIANIWQIHPFGEGNTRTTAVFAIKYLNSLGFEVNNEAFEKNSWYFRNALVRANYTNMNKGIYMNSEYLEKFFRNLLLGENNELRNRLCHIKGENLPVNGKNLPVNLPVNKTQQQMLSLLIENPNYTYSDLAEKIGKTRETIRTNLRKLEDMGLIKRIGADKNGHWIVNLK